MLYEFGQRAALRGGNPYRARAYKRAAESLLTLTVPLATVVEQGLLEEVPGIGSAIADIVTRLHRTGTHPTLEAMRADIPVGVLDLMEIPGLSPEKVLTIYRELGITSLDQLEAAAKADALKAVKGLGPALQAKVLQGIELRRSSRGLRHLHRAGALLEQVTAQLRKSEPSLKRITPAGDFRRGCELVGDLVLVAEVSGPAAAPFELNTGGEACVHVVPKQTYGSALLIATGSEAHVQDLRRLAAAQGWMLDAAGLREGKRLLAGAEEEEIYRALGLPFIAPELREGRGEIDLARRGRLPPLVSDNDLRGVLHAHTDASDGADTLAIMAEAARERGYGYFGVADHSRSAHYAGGLSLEEINLQHAEVGRLNCFYEGSFRIFKGIESDILPDGTLDYPDDVLAQFDFVVASVHSRFKLERAAQTDRILQAVANPYTTILGHMTGRQLLRRPGYDVDLEEVLRACGRFGVAVEINANPWRLDLDWRWHQCALQHGCMLSINPDAHSTAELDLTHWGIEMARKGGVPAKRVLNCLDVNGLSKHFAARRRAAVQK